MNGIPTGQRFGKQVQEIVEPSDRRMGTGFEHVCENEASSSKDKLTGRNEVGHWLETFLPIRDAAECVTAVAALAVEIGTGDHARSERLVTDFSPLLPKASDCLERYEKEIQEQARQLAGPPWIENDLRSSHKPVGDNPIKNCPHNGTGNLEPRRLGRDQAGRECRQTTTA
jgi:hypothetical protein